ncbi:TPA: hypothetical protein ACS53N_004681, partial [Salmonella enterica]
CIARWRNAYRAYKTRKPDKAFMPPSGSNDFPCGNHCCPNGNSSRATSPRILSATLFVRPL